MPTNLDPNDPEVRRRLVRRATGEDKRIFPPWALVGFLLLIVAGVWVMYAAS